MDNYLAHYGILGMKWGIRRTPEQLGRHTIKKGTKFYRQTVDYDEKAEGKKYVSYLQPDRDAYKGIYANEIRGYRGYGFDKRIMEKTYKAVEDIVVPSRKELFDVMDDIAFGNPKLAEQAAYNRTYKMAKRNYDRELTNDKYASLSKEVKELYSKSWAMTYATKHVEGGVRPILAMGKQKGLEYMKSIGKLDNWHSDFVQSTAITPEYTNRIIKELKSRGYNAMVDENGVGGVTNTREGVDPLIMFNVEKSLAEVSSKVLSVDEEYAAWQRSKQWIDVTHKNKYNGEAW